MTKKNLRAVTISTILFFSLSTVTAPVRAILPLLAAGVTLISEGGLAANGLAALTVGTVAGMVYLGSRTNGAGTSSGSILDIPLGLIRDRPLDVPVGYTASVLPAVQPVPPSFVSPVAVYYISTLAYSPAGACTAWAAPYLGAADYVGVALTGPLECTISWTTYKSVSVIGQGVDCPAGYSVSGAQCGLTNPVVVQKPPDGRCQILMNVSGFTVDPQDPECGDLASNGVYVSPTQVVYGKPGDLTNGKVAINGDGSRTITYSTANSNNTTTITTVNATPAPVGGTATITGTSVVVVNGTGTAVGTTPIPAAGNASPIVFPDDYNREVTQGQIKTGIDDLHKDLDSSGFVLPQPAALTSAQLAVLENNKITDVLDGSVGDYNNFKMLDWSTWIPVFPSASCSPITKTFMGKPLSWDFCPYVMKLNELIGWLFSIFAAWSVVGLMFRGRAS